MILFRFMSNTYSGITQKVFAIIPESLFDFDRNRCSICSGMTVRFAPEFTPDAKMLIQLTQNERL